MSVHLEIGSENEMAAVFSCPGRHEEIEKKPAAQTTGNNLAIIFTILNRELDIDIFTRGRATITGYYRGYVLRLPLPLNPTLKAP